MATNKESLIRQFNASVGSRSVERSVAEFYLEMCENDVEAAVGFFKEENGQVEEGSTGFQQQEDRHEEEEEKSEEPPPPEHSPFEKRYAPIPSPAGTSTNNNSRSASGEKDGALLQLQLQQGRASLQAAAAFGEAWRNALQQQQQQPGAASVPGSSAVDPHMAAAQDRHVFRNTAKPGYHPSVGAFSRNVQVEDQAVAAAQAQRREVAQPTLLEDDEDMGDAYLVEENPQNPRREPQPPPPPRFWWQKYSLLKNFDRQDFFFSVLVVVLVVVAVSVSLGVALSRGNESVSRRDTDAPSMMPSMSSAPSVSAMPSSSPSISQVPSATPSMTPSAAPSLSSMPSSEPTISAPPSSCPSVTPSATPSTTPTAAPTVSVSPTNSPTISTAPSSSPTHAPTRDLEPIKKYILTLLPLETRNAIDASEDSPQAQALQFTALDRAQDQNAELPDWRILQRFALATLYYAANGEGWRNNHDWLNHRKSECLWGGVASPCSTPTGDGFSSGNNQWGRPNDDFDDWDFATPGSNRRAYKRLWLEGNRLQGTLPPEIFLFLPDLQVLEASNNEIRGRLPTEVGQARSLRSINLSQNQMTGKLPTHLGALFQLTSLSLANNQFSGFLPEGLTGIRRLERLDLDGNPGLSGEVSDDLCGVIEFGCFEDSLCGCNRCACSD